MERFKSTVIVMLLAIGLLAPTVQAKSPARQLQEGLYQEQVSGDLDAAIEIYQKVIVNAAEYKRYTAQAHYRLALCYIKKGEEQKAIQHFETILNNYPDQKRTAAKAKKELKKIKPQTGELSEQDRIIASSYVIHYKTLGTNEDGLTVFNRSHPKGVKTHHANRYRKDGKNINSICTDNKTGKDKIVTMIENNGQLALVKVETPKQSQSNNPTVISTTPDVYANDISPNLSEITVTFDRKMADGSWSWTGGGDSFPEINGKIHYDPSYTTCNLPVKLKPGNVYWIGINSPSHKNFKTSNRVPAKRHVILFATKDINGKPTPIPQDMLRKAKDINRNSSSGKLQLTDAPWVDGEKMSLKLATLAGMDIGMLEHMLWFSADKHRYLVKYDSGAAIMSLTQVSVADDEPTTIRDEDYNFTLKLPGGWLYAAGIPGQYKISKQLIPPQLKAWALLTATDLTGINMPVRQIAEGDIEVLKGFFKNYTVRGNSWTEKDINGAPAAIYAADYKDKVDMVEYRAYIKTKSLVYWFVFRIEKEKFEKEKQQFDSIVNSFKVAPN